MKYNTIPGDITLKGIKMKDLTVFTERRTRLISKLAEDAIFILESAKEINRNNDNAFVFRQDSNFYYLTGIDEPDVIAIIIPARDKEPEQFILFSKPKNPKDEVWKGKVMGQEGAIEQFHATKSFPIADFEKELATLIRNKKNIYYPRTNKELKAKVDHTLDGIDADVQRGKLSAYTIHNAILPIGELRSIKDADEIDMIREAVQASEKAHFQAMQTCSPGLKELDIAAHLSLVFNQEGATQELAYPNIVASGANACTLHYEKNKDTLKDGDLLLIDASCEKDLYASDITRTFPINGTYSKNC